MSRDRGEAGILPDSSSLRIGVVAARYNPELVEGLLGRVRETLAEAGVPADHLEVHRVPGSMEVPFGLGRLARQGRCDALLGLGVVIGGDTHHHEVIAESTARSLQDLSLRHDLPIINGILVVDSLAQAEARVGGAHDRGAEYARAALELAHFPA